MNNTDGRIDMAQQEGRCVGIMQLLVHFILLFLQFSLPGMSEATVYAYTDAKGELHYAPVEDNQLRKLRRNYGKSTNPQIIVGKSTLLSKAGSGAQPLNEFIQAAATEHGVDPLLVKAVIKAESNFDPMAVSHRGAQGLMQLMPATAKELQVADPFDPLENIAGGTKYLRYLLESYNWDMELSLAAYNAGPGNVKNAFPDIGETRTYVSKVLRFYQFYQSNK